jgi:hypothetical protein
MYAGSITGQRRAIKFLWATAHAAAAGENAAVCRSSSEVGLRPSAVGPKLGERIDSASPASAVGYLFQVASIVSSRRSQASTLGISRLNSTIRV